MNPALNKMLEYCEDPISTATRRKLSLAANGIWEEWLRTTIESEELLERHSEQARWHPNGFLKLTLAEGDDGRRIRLHIWPPNDRFATRQDIHDHYWDFSSVVIAGALSIEHYLECGSKEGIEFESAVLADFWGKGPGDRRYYFRPAQNLRLICGKRETARAGDTHWLKCGDFHRTYNETDQFAVSLLLHSPPKTPQTTVCFPAGMHSAPPTTHLRSIAPQEFHRLLMALPRE